MRGHHRPRSTGVYAMATATMRVTTTVDYRGLPITIIGDPRRGLLTVAGYGSSQELVIAAIHVRRGGGQCVYRVPGGEWTPSLEEVAEATARGRKANDAH